MNKQLRDGMNGLAKGTSAFFENLGQSVVSILRMFVLSSFKIARQSKKYPQLKTSRDCCVLGNGPSLKDDFENGRVRTEDNDIFCVNMFCSSPLFRALKPKFYFLVDGTYFAPKNERGKKLVEELVNALNKVDWEMCLVVSSSAVSGGSLFKEIHNSYIKLLQVNTVTVNGFRNFRHWVYRNRLGMPQCQTVVNFALCFAINLGYDNIFLYGADHTWTRDLFVNEENVVCYGDRHVYNKQLTIVKKENNFAHLLDQFSAMFKAHYLLEDYSKSQGVKIWNCACDTFLDSYERIKDK